MNADGQQEDPGELDMQDGFEVSSLLASAAVLCVSLYLCIGGISPPMAPLARHRQFLFRPCRPHPCLAQPCPCTNGWQAEESQPQATPGAEERPHAGLTDRPSAMSPSHTAGKRKTPHVAFRAQERPQLSQASQEPHLPAHSTSSLRQAAKGGRREYSQTRRIKPNRMPTLILCLFIDLLLVKAVQGQVGRMERRSCVVDCVVGASLRCSLPCNNGTQGFKCAEQQHVFLCKH